MRCPDCGSENTYVTETRRKKQIEEKKIFDISDAPRYMKMYDYRVRRHRCRDCYYTFSTIESYYNHEDIEKITKRLL